MFADYYEFTMACGYYRVGLRDNVAVFDLFFRAVPDGGGFAVAAGLAQAAEYVENLRFAQDDIDYLRSAGGFDEDFLRYLLEVRFTGDITAVPEGTPVFPGEPLLTVRAPVIEAQLLETALLTHINHQSLIATKAARITAAARGRPVADFGARRAHGEGAAVFGARAAYIGGCASTSCVPAGQRFGIPVSGTMAHSWVQLFDNEYDAFMAYIKQYPQNPTLLVDTYDTFFSGLPAAAQAFIDSGCTTGAVRIDSGDLCELARDARRFLNYTGLHFCKVVASNSLDEYSISELLDCRAPIDAFGVGERLLTAKSDPVFGGVYKLAAAEHGGVSVPKVKHGDGDSKATIPCHKALFRVYRPDGRAARDIIALRGESPPGACPLHVPVFSGGKRVYTPPPLSETRAACARQIAALPPGVRRLYDPSVYPVSLSRKLKAETLRARAGMAVDS
jgi:nicotinate phosphoribosyltransferase